MVLTVRAGTYAGYDHFVVEFNGSVPRYEVRMQDEPAFVLSPKGESVTLDGSAGVLIRLEPALDWTLYTGPAALHPGYQFIREARLLENLEAVQQWGLACPRRRAYTSSHWTRRPGWPLRLAASLRAAGAPAAPRPPGAERPDLVGTFGTAPAL